MRTFLPSGMDPSSHSRVNLAFTTFKLLTPTQPLVLLLAHLFSSFFQHAGHAVSLLQGAECRSFVEKLQAHRGFELILIGAGPNVLSTRNAMGQAHGPLDLPDTRSYILRPSCTHTNFHLFPDCFCSVHLA